MNKLLRQKTPRRQILMQNLQQGTKDHPQPIRISTTDINLLVSKPVDKVWRECCCCCPRAAAAAAAAWAWPARSGAAVRIDWRLLLPPLAAAATWLDGRAAAAGLDAEVIWPGNRRTYVYFEAIWFEMIIYFRTSLPL